jgi:hypothetical protein
LGCNSTNSRFRGAAEPKSFLSIDVVVLAITSELFLSAYPCDDLCNTNTIAGASETPGFLGSHSLTSLSNESFVATVEEDDTIYRFCDQDFLERLPALKNFFSKQHGDWMSSDQENMSFVFGIYAIGVVSLMIFVNMHEDVQTAQTEAWGGFASTSALLQKSPVSEQTLIRRYIDFDRAGFG